MPDQSIVHTPGPWKTSHKNGRVVVALSEFANEKIATAANTGNPPVAWANARLLAESPEMLKVIEIIANATGNTDLEYAHELSQEILMRLKVV